MEVLFLVSRVLLALVFVLPGIQVHLLQRAPTLELARRSRVPVPELLVPLAGVVMVTGGAMVILGLWADLGALLLASFSLAAAPVHAFWREQDQLARQIQLGNFAKNLGLAAGALLVFYAYQEFPEAAFSLTGPLL
jgi:putative oxidoreductase